MEKNKLAVTKAVYGIVDKLPEIPGWHSLGRNEQDSLVTYTDELHKYRQLQGLGEFGQLMVLTQVQQLIDGKEMSMDDYLRFNYPQHHQRTIHRKQQAFAELAATIPNPILKKLSAFGQDVIAHFDRIATATLGDIRNAIREMPLLPVSTDKDAEKWLVELDGKLLEERQNRRKVAGKAPDQEFIEKVAANELVNHITQAKLKTSSEKRQFLTRVIGWTMEAHAVHGTLRAGRIPIPGGVLRPKGRPTMTEEEKEKARKARERRKKVAA